MTRGVEYTLKPNRRVAMLARPFGIRIKQARKIKAGVYQVTTAGGHVYALKRMPRSIAVLRWTDLTLQRLQARLKDSCKLAWRNPAEPAGKRLYTRYAKGLRPFVLNPWLKGEYPSPSSLEQMRDCGALIARFHEASRLCSIPKSGMRNTLGSWRRLLGDELRMLQRAISRASRNGFGSPLDRLLQTHGLEALGMGRASIRSLMNSPYRSLCRSSPLTVCHGDFGPSNILFSSGGLSVIDFETLRMDLRAYDLYRMIYNSSHNDHWNFAIAQSILDGYREVAPLTSADYAMLRILLRFPRGICKLVQPYMSKKRSGPEIAQLFNRVLSEERARGEYIKRLDAYAASHGS